MLKKYKNKNCVVNFMFQFLHHRFAQFLSARFHFPFFISLISHTLYCTYPSSSSPTCFVPFLSLCVNIDTVSWWLYVYMSLCLSACEKYLKKRRDLTVTLGRILCTFQKIYCSQIHLYIVNHFSMVYSNNTYGWTYL